jgi:hypothetical protein
MLRVMILAALLACQPASVKLDPKSASDLADLCDASEQTVLTESIDFPQWTDGCAWGEDGNDDRQDAYFSARREEVHDVTVSEGAAICGISFDFGGPEGGESTPMVYDDNFVFTFDDIVLATSYAPLLDLLPEEDGYKVWDWDAVVGTALSFDTSIPSWCLGQDEGVSTCEIPLPEQRGTMSLSFGDTIVDDLSYAAYEQDRYSFDFITLGDNDDTDCSHEDFSFTVELPTISL